MSMLEHFLSPLRLSIRSSVISVTATDMMILTILMREDRYGIDYYNKIAPIEKSVQITFGVIRFMKGLLEKLFPDIEILSQLRWLRLFFYCSLFEAML